MDNNIIEGRGIAAGTNNYTVELSVDVNELKDGGVYTIEFTNGNSAASDLDINGIGTVDIANQFGIDVLGGEIPAGSILQLQYSLASDKLKIISNASSLSIQDIQSVLKTDRLFISAVTPTWADVTGLTLTFQPSKASDKFKIEGYINTGNANNEAGFIRILRIVDPLGTPVETPLAVGDAAGSRTRTTFKATAHSVDDLVCSSWSFMDSPGTTDEVLYKVQATKTTGVSSLTINCSFADLGNASHGRTACSLVVWHFN